MPIDQADVIAWLSSPEAHERSVERIDTHTSVIFLSGSHAFKLKRAIRDGDLDYSTIDRRHVCCVDEVRLNRRTAPMLYQGVQAVTQSSDGQFELDGDGRVADWLVVMNRFDRDAQLDRLSDRNALPLALMPTLATAIARLHDVAEWRFDHGGLEGISRVVEGNRDGLQTYGRDSLDQTDCEHLSATSLALARQHGHRLDARRRAGFVRHCHGDLHLGNICLVDGVPTLFDGVEFCASVGCVDVLYDLAFVLVDLLHRGLDQNANDVFNGYIDHTLDFGGLGLLPLFLSLRAAERAKTEALAAVRPDDQGRDSARRSSQEYLALAKALLEPAPPQLVAVGGGSGSGKTTLSRRLAAALGPRPGAIVLRSDVERKRLLGVPLHQQLGDEAYSPGITREVYRTLAARASLVLQEGPAVVVDAVCGSQMERAMLADVARHSGAPFSGLWLETPPATLSAGLEARSDKDSIPSSWAHLDASGDAQSVLQDAQRELARSTR